jgi:DnaJ-class molecular chaperone
MVPTENYAKEECRWCSGSAIDYGTGGPCAVCHGQGVIVVLTPSKSCAVCDGWGRPSPDQEIPCDACQGSGWAERFSVRSIGLG